jgi:transcriptional regulator with XRE-family HTH domain
MGEATIADSIREIRRRRGMSQQELAESAGLSVQVIKKLEGGGNARLETLHMIARALGVRTLTFVTPDSPEPREESADELVLSDMRSAIHPPISLSGRALYGTSDGDEPDLRRLRRAITAVSAAYHSDRYDDLAQFVPALVRSAHYHVDACDSTDEQREAQRARGNVLGLAGRYLIQIRAHDLALTALHGSLQDALAISNVPLAVAAISGQAHAMLRQGRFREVEQLCLDTAAEIEPKISQASEDELAAFGWAMIRAMAAAARNNRPDEAKEYLSVATAAAARIQGEHRTPDDKTFGQATVALKGPENAMVAGRPDEALRLSRHLSEEGLRDEEWNRHKLDVALASVRTGDPDRATDVLNDLRRKTPHWLRYQQHARDTTREILATRPRTLTEDQRALADFLNVIG